MKLDYSKTINEQQEVFDYYKNNYLSYQLEIERLNNIIKNYEINTIPTLEHNIDVLVDSEDRLNNIINELEKTLLEWHEYWEDDDDYNFEYKKVYDYLQELKEKK